MLLFLILIIISFIPLCTVLEFYLNHIPVTLYSLVGEPIARPVALCRQQLRLIINIAHLV